MPKVKLYRCKWTLTLVDFKWNYRLVAIDFKVKSGCFSWKYSIFSSRFRWITLLTIVSHINNRPLHHSITPFFIYYWEFTILMFSKAVDCIIMHWDLGVKVECFMAEFSLLTLKVMATNPQFHLNATCAKISYSDFTDVC